MILICYDGSDDAKAAIQQAAKLLSDEPATLLTVWQPFTLVLARAPVGYGMMPSLPDADEIDRANEASTKESAEEGAALAREAGFDVEARTCRQVSTIAEAIFREADEVDASAIVMGSRGLTRVKSLFLGSVSQAVIQHADRPVFVVPSPEVATARARSRAE